jgi:SAM-dependent methyltransferase
MKVRGNRLEQIADYGKQVDFGKASCDKARYRAGDPDQLCQRLRTFGVGLAGRRVRSAPAFSDAALRATVDASLDSTSRYRWWRRAAARRVRRSDNGLCAAKAEMPPFRNRTFEVVGAGQSWHWFDRDPVAAEAQRMLRPAASLDRGFRLDCATGQRGRGDRESVAET